MDTPEFPEGYKPEARDGRDFLEVLRAEKTVDWVFLSPSAEFEPGERTGKYRLGGDHCSWMRKAAAGYRWRITPSLLPMNWRIQNIRAGVSLSVTNAARSIVIQRSSFFSFREPSHEYQNCSVDVRRGLRQSCCHYH
jgi:hypothetical protein